MGRTSDGRNARPESSRQPVKSTHLHAAAAALVFIASAAAFAAIARGVFGGGYITVVDHELAAWIHTQATPAWMRFMTAVSDLHRPRAILAGTAAAALVLLWKQDRAGLLMLLVTVGGGAALNHVLKHGFKRPRPGDEGAWVAATDFSFPSGHVSNATLLYGIVAALIVCGSRSRAVQGAAVLCAAVLVLLVAASRLVLGGHHLSDVLAGATVGLGSLSLCLIVALLHGAQRPGMHRCGV